MRSRLLVVAVVAAALAGLYWMRRGGKSEPAAAAPSSTKVAAPAQPAPTAPRPPAHVTKLSPEERSQVADRIAKAHAARAATHAPEAPSLPPSAPATPPPALPASPPNEELRTSLRDAMREALPILAECYTKHAPDVKALDVKAHLTLTGDPDVGTIIDAHQLEAGNQQPLAAAFDDCLRDTFQQLQLPPLAEGDKVEVTYPLRFESD